MLAVVSLAALAPAALGASSPKARYAASLAAARGMRSVHYVASESSGGTRATYVGDVTATGGVQRISFDLQGTTGHVTVVVSKHRAWVRGDVPALAAFLDFPPAVAAKDANRWVIVPKADYASVARDVTLPSVIDDLEIVGTLSTAPGRRVGGRLTFGVRGRLPGQGGGTLTLYARAAGRPLPAETVTTGQAPATLVLSGWNERVRPPAPVDAVTVPSGARPSGPAVPA